ncbi:MAG: efflux RND transporter periplasmic adaptor subunit [Gammaproteobacteria bacterium]|nr:efflux RND transporter periplasmic adaptor subunit [Gammaproteobacteria bacterium]
MSSNEKDQQPIILPKLRQGILCVFNDYDTHGNPHWMINDPGRNKFFIIGWAEYQIYQEWHLGNVDKIIEAVNTKTTLNIDKTDIEHFYHFLKANYLIQQSGYNIFKQAKEQQLFSKDNWIRWLIDHYLFFRVPIWHPDNFLIRTNHIARFIFNRNVFYIMIILGFVAIYQLSTQWANFTHTFASIFTLQGLIFYFIAFSVCKFCHEMGHAYMCRRYNIPVQSLGVAFLVFWPVLYTDTTLSWVLKSRQRMKIALAGIWIETYVTIFAALIWCNTDNVTLKSICYMVISVNWMLSLLINVSPFMRFDGYYILADFLKMPNLQPRAFALTRWQIRRWLFDWQDPPPEIYAKNLKRFLIIYSFCTWIYRLSLYLGIATLVYHFFIKFVGVILFGIEIYYFILRPFLQEIHYWHIAKEKFSWNKNSIITLLSASLIILLFFVPIQTSINLPATVSYAHEFLIAQEGGIIDNQVIAAGSPVTKGEIIFKLKSVDLENSLNLVRLKYNKQLMELRNAKINKNDISYTNVILSEINKSQAEYSKLNSLYEKLTMRAPFNGVLYEVSPDLVPGVYVMKNEWLADIVDLSGVVVEAYIKERDLSRINRGDMGYFYPSHLSEKKIPVQLTDIDTLNTNQLNCRYSKTIKLDKNQSINVDTPCYQANEIGGEVATYVAEDGSYVPVESVYRIVLSGHELEKLNYVERGTVVIYSKPTSYAAQFFYWLKSLLVSQSGF